MISFILPTHDRPRRLRRTLQALGGLPLDVDDAEVIVVDNGSDPPAAAPATLANGLAVRVLRLERNRGAAGRNAAAAAARGVWLVMLDDDSRPLDAGFLDVLAAAPPDVAAVGADIRLPDGTREAGGLPEVYVGCGAAVRRDAFVDAGGYDASFHYYAEEYDLCARLLLAGFRVVHDDRFRVVHEKTAEGRDIGLIVRRLVRNNGWVLARYAPDPDALVAETVARYGRIARHEGVRPAWVAGLRELTRTIDAQPRRPMPRALFDRFTGLAHVRETLGAELGPGDRVTVVDEGKNAWVVHAVLAEIGAEAVPGGDTLVIGTLSPGPMLDAWERRGPRALRPWTPGLRVAELHAPGRGGGFRGGTETRR